MIELMLVKKLLNVIILHLFKMYHLKILMIKPNPN